MKTIIITIRLLGCSFAMAFAAITATASEEAALGRAANAAAQLLAGQKPALYLVVVQDSGEEAPFAGSIASFEITKADDRVEKTVKEGKTKWTFFASVRKHGQALHVSGRFDGFVDIGSERWVSKGAAVGGGIGFVGDVKGRIRTGEPLLLTSSQLQNVPGKQSYSETVSLYLVWK